MFTKRATLTDIRPAVLSSRNKTAEAISGFDFEPDPAGGYLYVTSRALTSDIPNLNYDMFPHEEMKEAYKTFIGCPVFVDHHNTDDTRARGVILDAKYHDEDPEDRWTEILMELDEVTFPELCRLVRDGEIDTMSMGCFVPGTPITLSDGTTKPIENIAEGDEVVTHEGNVKPVSYTMVHEHNGIIYEISSYAGGEPMRLTEEHPVWVRRPHRDFRDTVRARIDKNKGAFEHRCLCGREFANHASLSAHLREANRHHFDGEHGFPPDFEGWIEAKDVEIGDYVLDPSIGITTEGNRDFARLLGYYLAEGNFGYAAKGGAPSFVEWTFNENEVDYHKEVAELVSSLGYKPVGPYFKNGAATIRCNSSELAQRMLEHGGKYSWGKKVSDEVMRWDEESQRTLLEAYLNGDAHWGKGTDTHFEFSTVSKTLAEQIYSMCIRCGIRCSEPRMYPPVKNEYANERRPFFYAQGDFGEASEGAKHLSYVDEEGVWRRVTKIRMVEYHGDVYNFEVEDDHSYVASGCAVHNCTVESTTCSVCGNEAADFSEFCNHINQKGATFDGELAYEICHGIDFIEESFVYDPACPEAIVGEINDQYLAVKAARRRVAASKRHKTEMRVESLFL